MAINFSDFVRETRNVGKGLHSIVLEIPEDTYKAFYGDPDEEGARDIVAQHLKLRQDDAMPQDVKILCDGDTHIVSIYANLHYLGNEKTQL